MTNSATRTAGLSGKDLFRVYLEALIAPHRAYSRRFGAHETSMLTLSFFIASLIFALLTMPFVIETLREYFRSHAEISASMRVTSVGLAVGIGASLNLLLIASVTAVLALGLAIMGRPVEFANNFALILLASTPTLIDRVFSLARGIFDDPDLALKTSVPLSLFFQADGVAGDALSYFGVFDVWRSALVLFAMVKAANGRMGEALGYFLMSWLLLIAALFRIQTLELLA